jgi:hypothetical protein
LEKITFDYRPADRGLLNRWKWQLVSFALLLLLFSGLTFWFTYAGIDRRTGRTRQIVQTTAATIAGPMTGAVARDFQVCCTRFSLHIMAYCAPVLGLALLVQLFSPRRGWLKGLLLMAWVTGWLVWFGGGIFSFFHALT